MAASPPRRLRWRHRLLAVALLAAVVSPLVTDHDDFPLSTYPMYAWSRPRVEEFATVVGIDRSGASRPLSTELIARTDDPLLAQVAVDQAIEGGRAGELCTDVAGRVGPGLVRLEVIRERRDVVAEAAGRPSLQARAVEASCEVAT